MNVNRQYGIGVLLTVTGVCLMNLTPVWSAVVLVSALITLGSVLYRVL